jgi:hypothetical protein
MPHTVRIETTLAAWSLVRGLLTDFAGLLLIGRLPWPLSVALVGLGSSVSLGPCSSSQLPIGTAEQRRPQPQWITGPETTEDEE